MRKIPWKRKWKHTPVFLPRDSHGERSLTGYSPCRCERGSHDRVAKHAHTHENYQNSRNNMEEKEACIRNLATSLPQFIDSFFFSYKSSRFLISSSVKFDFSTRQALTTMNAVNLCLFPKRGSIKEGHFVLI